MERRIYYANHYIKPFSGNANMFDILIEDNNPINSNLYIVSQKYFEFVNWNIFKPIGICIIANNGLYNGSTARFVDFFTQYFYSDENYIYHNGNQFDSSKTKLIYTTQNNFKTQIDPSEAIGLTINNPKYIYIGKEEYNSQSSLYNIVNSSYLGGYEYKSSSNYYSNSVKKLYLRYNNSTSSTTNSTATSNVYMIPYAYDTVNYTYQKTNGNIMTISPIYNYSNSYSYNYFNSSKSTIASVNNDTTIMGWVDKIVDSNGKDKLYQLNDYTGLVSLINIASDYSTYATSAGNWYIPQIRELASYISLYKDLAIWWDSVSTTTKLKIQNYCSYIEDVEEEFPTGGFNCCYLAQETNNSNINSELPSRTLLLKENYSARSTNIYGSTWYYFYISSPYYRTNTSTSGTSNDLPWIKYSNDDKIIYINKIIGYDDGVGDHRQYTLANFKSTGNTYWNNLNPSTYESIYEKNTSKKYNCIFFYQYPNVQSIDPSI